MHTWSRLTWAVLAAAVGGGAALLLLGGDSVERPPKDPIAASADGRDTGDTSDAEDRRARRRAAIRARRRAALTRLAKRVDRRGGRPATIRVVDCELLPAPGAVVSVTLDGQVYELGATDEVGGLRTTLPEDATIVAEARLGDRAGASEPTSDADLTVNICPGATIEGVVVDEEGRALPGAEVVLGEGQDIAVADAEGRFVLTDLWLTAPHVAASHGGASGELVLEPLEADETREVTVKVPKARTLVGRVVDAEQQEGVGYATVVAKGADGVVLATATSMRDGRFWLKGVPFEPVQVRGYVQRGASTVRSVGASEIPEDLILELQPAAVVEIVGAPQEPSDVTYHIVDVSRPGNAVIATVRGGADGVVHVPAPGRVWVRRTWSDGSSGCGELEVVPGGEYRVDCRSDQSPAVSGQVLDSETGEPVAGAEVSVMYSGGPETSPGMERGITAADGTFRVELADGRTARVAIRARGYYPVTRRNVPLSRGIEADLGVLDALSWEDGQALYSHRPFGGIGGAVGESQFGIAFNRIVKGGPLDQAGIRSGDVLVAVEGERVATVSVQDAVRSLRGEEGSEVELTVRSGETERILTVRRETIDVDASGWR